MLVRTMLMMGLIAAPVAAVTRDEPPAPFPPQETTEVSEPAAEARTLHDFTVTTMDGKERSLGEYEGKVVLVVNVASRCGLTPQYEALQRLFEEKEDEGLVILAFPANNFGNQEPGTNQQILAFCREQYAVTFPVFAKISVKGEGQHELYEWLTSLPQPEESAGGPGGASREDAGEASEGEPAVGGEIKWNFTKFLFGPDGRPVARFEPRTTPDDPALVSKVDELLSALPEEEEASAGAEAP